VVFVFQGSPDETRDGLSQVVREFGNVGNPLDVTGQGVFQPELLERSLDLLADDPAVDAIVYARSFPSRLDGRIGLRSRARTRHSEPSRSPFPGGCRSAGGHFFPAPTTEHASAATPGTTRMECRFLRIEYGLKAVSG